jgi:putative Mg2+ transporter-C (MgtC) family protein
MPAETLYEIRLACKVSGTAHIRSLLLSTISNLPLTLQSIHGEQDEDEKETHIRAEVCTAGRNNEALEQVVMRLFIFPQVYSLGKERDLAF